MSEPDRAAFRIGSFAVAGLVVLLGAIVAVGGRLFADAETAVMRFDRSVWGLQVGAPVVLRGVRVGEVIAIGLAPSATTAPAGAAAPGAALSVPVTARFDSQRLRDMLEPGTAGAALPALLQAGLVARLSTQSLLTGLLYVDLDLDPARAATGRSTTASSTSAVLAGERGVASIPTATTRLQDLQSQLEGLDLRRLAQDLGAAAQALKAVAAGPEIRAALSQVARAATEVSRLSRQAQAAVAPAAESLRDTLQQVQRSAAALEPTAREAQSAAQQVAAAASEARALAAAGQPLVADMRRSADELTRAAQALRQTVAEDSALARRADAALGEIGRAASALRELAQMLERNPESLLRGRPK